MEQPPEDPRTPCHLFLDFDGTLTPKSTLAAIASLDYTATAKFEPWFEQYAQDLRDHTAKYKPAKEDRKTLEQETAWLDSLLEIERKSILRIEGFGMFRNIRWNTDFPKILGDCVDRAIAQGTATLREDAGELIRAWLGDHNDCGSKRIDVLSVNWCRDWIKKMLDGLEIDTPIGVASNEIDQKGSGRLSRTTAVRDGIYFVGIIEDIDFEKEGLWTARHKLNIMKEMIKTRWNKDHGCASCYIGDSPTDLLCLLEADVGICIQDDPMTSEQYELKDTLNRLRIEVLHIREVEIHRRPSAGQYRVYFANALKEVCEVLFTRASASMPQAAAAA